MQPCGHAVAVLLRLPLAHAAAAPQLLLAC